MSPRLLSIALCSLLAVTSVASTGCVTRIGFSLGYLGVPIPVSPYFQKRQEDKFWLQERYERAAVLGPITPGSPAIALDVPSDDEVMVRFGQARPIQGGLPMFHEVQRNNIRIVKEKIADYLDPPRVVPLLGPVQLHHAHYKCTIYFTEVTRVGWPVPYTTVDEDSVEVIYIDHNHFHMVGNVDPGTGSPY
ncbi:hypothetical protein [Lignipirellula cremea]|uniref:Lipoprotein n=1 Tax=Lignipirellula cremea TaxID=2528010 RepID=A0A518DY43_9BACT|nr:hypothetical protein [Lignipirellula cremea]QDU96721.1 hypothetical protein Pla8534_45420 [Lignipirellula cremea]